MKAHEDLARELAKATNFPKRVAYARQLAGYSQGELARRVSGKTGSMVCGWERGTTKPMAKNAKMAAKVLGVRLEWLLHGDGDMHPVETFSTGEPDAKLGTIAPQLATIKSNGTHKPPEGLDMQGRLRWAIKHSGMSLQEIGDAVGVSKATLGFWSASKDAKYRRPIKPEYVAPLAVALGVTAQWLQDGSLPVWAAGHSAPAAKPAPEPAPKPTAPAEEKIEPFEYVPILPPRVSGFVNVSLVEAQLADAVARRNEAAHEAEQWQSILNTLRNMR